MSNPELCNECYRKQACQLWRNAALRQEIETDGCEYYEEHAPTNFDRLTESPETLAKTLVHFDDDEWYGRQWFGLVGNITWKSFSTKQAAVAATVEYLNQEVSYE